MDIWQSIQQYAKTAQQLEWLQQQFATRPPLQNQSARDWIIWRTNVAKGMTELAALQSTPAFFNSSQTAGPSRLGMEQLNPTFQNTNNAPYGFVNMNSVAPRFQQGNAMNGGAMFQPMDGGMSTAGPSHGQQTISPSQMQFQQHQQQVQQSPQYMQQQTLPQANQAALQPTGLQNMNPIFLQSAAQQTVKQEPVYVDLTQSPPEKKPRLEPEGSPFDSLGDASLPSDPSSSLRVVPVVKKVAVSPIPPTVDASRLASSSRPDSSSISRQIPSASGVKRPAPEHPPRNTGVRLPQKSSHDKAQGITTMADILPEIQLGILQTHNKPGRLFKYLRQRVNAAGDDIGPLFDANPAQLAEIISALSKHASNSYLRLMADNDRYSETIEEWLRKFIKDPAKWEASIAPLLRMLARTDMPVNYIKDMGIGRFAKRLNDKVQDLQLKSAPEVQKAFERYRDYCKDVLFVKGRTLNDESGSESEARAKKKPKVEAKPDIKPDVKPSVAKPAPPKAGRTDMSFFGGPQPAAPPKPKPKAPLPSFSKRAAPPPPAAVPAKPAGGLLSATLKMLKREESPPMPVPAADSKSDVKPKAEHKGVKPNKKGHIVRWVDLVPSPPAERPLEAIKLFTEEAFELERPPWQIDEDGVHGMSTHQMDMQEGRALRHHEEVTPVIEWYEPQPYAVPEEDQRRPLVTDEVTHQDERERAILAVSYPDTQIPSTPDEAGVRIVQRDNNTRQMNSLPPQAEPELPTSVSALLSNLNLPNLQPAQPQPQGYGYGSQYNYQQQAGWTPQAQAPGWNPAASASASASASAGASGWGGPQAQAKGWNGSGYNASHSNYNNSTNNNNNPGYNSNSNPNYRPHNNYNRFQNREGRMGYNAAGKPAEICRHFQRGHCELGKRCHFAHE